MKYLLFSLLAVSILTLAGCASSAKVINAYSGPERSDQEVAILFTAEIDSPSFERRSGLLSAVNGRTVGSYMTGYPAATKVLPGNHLIKVGCPGILVNNLDFRLLRFTFEAGHFYELICAQFSVVAVDRGTSFASVEPLLSDSLKSQLRR